MIEAIISSKTRVRLLLKFFLNSNHESYLRGLTSEFGESSNAIRLELNRLSAANMINCELKGNKKFFKANKKHPLFNELHNIVLKHSGIDKIVDNVIGRLGELKSAYIVGNMAEGRDTKVIDLVLIGQVDIAYLIKLIAKAEQLINKKIRYIIYDEADQIQENQSKLLIWSNTTE